MTGADFLLRLKQSGCKGNGYSDNLVKWLKKRKDWPLEAAFLHWSNIDGSHVEMKPEATQPQQILLGIGPDREDKWFHGARLSEILCSGAKANVFAFPPRFETTPLPDWFGGYIKGGKCFIDPEHRWYGDRDRWQLSDDGNSRVCLWCGEHMQEKFVTERTVIDTHWRAK